MPGAWDNVVIKSDAVVEQQCDKCGKRLKASPFDVWMGFVTISIPDTDLGRAIAYPFPPGDYTVCTGCILGAMGFDSSYFWHQRAEQNQGKQ